MISVPRLAKKANDVVKYESQSNPVTLGSLRSMGAWVLLGEPGAGKTHVFKEEANATNSAYVKVADFIYGDLSEEWKGCCMFLDGLDECRASGEEVVREIRRRLAKLGSPSFRISCRAADWYGQADMEVISGASSSKIEVYTLLPLSTQDVTAILREKHKEVGADEFIRQAECHGISALLGNPQTLDLMIKAVGGGVWPTSRDEIYQRACNALIEEESRRHRDLAKSHPAANGDVLEAAGYIFSILLLSDKDGVARDKIAQSERFPAEVVFDRISNQLISRVLGTQLFVPSSTHDERLTFAHRSVAEYLAATWLSDQIDKAGMPLQRVLKLMLGFDGKVVSGLRGLYGWLALKSEVGSQVLVESDPLTVALYGDLQLMGREGKRQLINAIRFKVLENSTAFWDLIHDFEVTGSLSSLFNPELSSEYLSALRNQDRGDGSQCYAGLVLKVLELSAAPDSFLPELIAEVKKCITDCSRQMTVRVRALEVWLSTSAPDSERVELLDGFCTFPETDPDEELSGVLLRDLYPRAIGSKDVLRYLHAPRSAVLGIYRLFWLVMYPKGVADAELQHVTNSLCKREDIQELECRDSHVSGMYSGLVARAIIACGDDVDGAQVFDWLRLCMDDSSGYLGDDESHKLIREWFSMRPKRYLEILCICFARNESANKPRHSLRCDCQVLCGATHPPALGQWHFDRLLKTDNPRLFEEHLRCAVYSLKNEANSEGVLTVESLRERAARLPDGVAYLESLLSPPPDDLSIRQTAEILEQTNEQNESVKERTAWIAVELKRIECATATPKLLNELAGVWLKEYVDISGDTPLDRFKSYCDNYVEVYAAAMAGMVACVSRKDIPAVAEIVALHLENKSFFIRRPCLLGMDLIWEGDASAVGALDESILSKMVCFRLTDGTRTAPGWFTFLVANHPSLVASVLIDYAKASFGAALDYVDCIYPLEADALYERVARIAVPAILRDLPSSWNPERGNYLVSLLWAAIRHNMPELRGIIFDKLKNEEMKAGQRLFYLFAGALIEPGAHKDAFFNLAGHSAENVRLSTIFMGRHLSNFPDDLCPDAQFLGRLIELLAPHVDLELPMGGRGIYTLTPAMEVGDLVRALIGVLTSRGNIEALDEIDRLCELPAVVKMKRHLLRGKHELSGKVRDNTFKFHDLSAVAKILGNSPPCSAADLRDIVMACLDEIMDEIRSSNADLYRLFWTEGELNKHKDENSCRDALLVLLRPRLKSLGVEINPEIDHTGDNRSDLCASYQARYVLPIEIKGEWHRDIWTSIEEQLVKKYAGSDGHGIYLVFWFGGTLLRQPRDGGVKPSTPRELQARLYERQDIDAQRLIGVRVIDVSWSP